MKAAYIHFKQQIEKCFVGERMIMMNRKTNTYGVLSIVGLIVLPGMALGFDALVRFLGRNIFTFPSFPLGVDIWLLSTILTDLILAAASLLLFRFVINQAPRNVWVASLFLFTGLFIAAYPILYYIPNFLPSLSPSLDGLLATPRSYISYTGGLIAMAGLFALVFQRGK